MKAFSILSCIVLATVSLACVDNTPAPVRNADPVELCTVVKTAMVNRSIWDDAKARCMAGDPAPLFLESMPDSTARIASLRAECKPGDLIFNIFDNAITGGHVRFDKDRLEQCLATGKLVRGISAPEIFQEATLDLSNDPDCNGIAVPLVEANGVCTDQWDCMDGTLCQGDENIAEPLRCLPPVGIGEPCDDYHRCDPENMYCNSGVCAGRGGVGFACSSYLDCYDFLICDPSGTCGYPEIPAADGEFCFRRGCQAACSVCRPENDGDAEEQFKCLPRADLGSPCEYDSECVQGLYCNDSTYHCEMYHGVGDDCAAEGVSCASDLWCDHVTTNQCQPLPGVGGDCSQSISCQSGLLCMSGVCMRRGNAGDSCDPNNSICLYPLVCNGPTGAEICTEAAHVGEACIPDPNTCVDGAFCNAQGTCETKKPIGSLCTEDVECNGKCTNGTCKPYAAYGCGSTEDIIVSYFGFGVMACVSRLRNRKRRAPRP